MKRPKVIVITGTPATGKTTLAKRLSRSLGYEHIELNKLIGANKLYEGTDALRKCKIVDIRCLNRFLKGYINGRDPRECPGLILDSHLAHFLPRAYVDVVVVTSCGLSLLKRRLNRRKYPAEKVRENLDAEIFSVCATEAEEMKHDILPCTPGSGYADFLKELRQKLGI
ncbi:MAG: adenylate kinase family protein [archaeon]